MDDDWFEAVLDELGAIEDDRAVDEMLRLISNRHVRYTLYYLSEHPTTSLCRIADVVAGWEAVEKDRIITPDDRERIRIRLYHVALPKLRERGYIDFDLADQTVTRSNVPREVFDLLDVLP